MKQKLLLISLLLAPVFLQAQVEKYSIRADANSIIRSVSDDVSLIYTEVSDTESYFLLRDDADAYALAFRMPVGMQVRDVRIHNGEIAYFCGTYAPWNLGLIGMFKIVPIFYGGSSVVCGACYSTTNPYYAYPTDLKRLDLFDSAGLVCMAMVGSSISDLGTQVSTTTVTSAHHDNTWSVRTHINKGDEIIFTDIACLENTIVASGTDSTGRNCLVKAFQRTPDFLNNILTPTHTYRIDFLSPVGEVRATAAKGDTLLLAHYDNDAGVRTIVHKAAINATTGIPVAPVDTWLSDSCSAVAYGSSWSIPELAYADGSVILAQHANYMCESALHDWLVKLPLTATSSASMAWKPRYGTLQSMDPTPTTQEPRLSATKANLLTYRPTWLAADGACYYFKEPPFTQKEAEVRQSTMADDVDTDQTIDMTFAPTIFVVPVSTLCDNE